LRLELIGEEIYDEFDTQGAHGDPYEVPPANVFAQDFGAASLPVPPPQGQGSEVKSRPSSIHRFLTTVTGGGMSHDSAQTKVPQPQAAAAPKGFFRTRSAPPERDSNEAVVPPTGKTVRIDDKPKEAQAASPPAIHMPKPIRTIGRGPPSIILEQHSSASSSNSGVGTSLTPMTSVVAAALNAPSLGADGKSKTLPPSSSISYPSSPVVQQGVTPITTAASTPAHPVTTAAPPAHKLDKTPSRSTSPAPPPPLEAILLDRKRRLAAAHGQTPGAVLLGLNSPSVSMAGGGASVAPSPSPSLSTNVPHGHGKDGVIAGGSNTLSIPSPPLSSPSISKSTGASTGSGKGTRFKSSPLGGFDRSGVVVAEQVNAAYSKDAGEDQDQEHGDRTAREEM